MAKKKVVLIVLAAVVAVIALSYQAIMFSSKAKFCALCKNMEGAAYKTWLASKHSPEKVPAIEHYHECMACHSEPGLLGYIKAKSGGMLSCYYQLFGGYELPLKGTKPVHCSRPECHSKVEEIKEEKIIVNHPEHTELMGKIINEKFKCIPCHRGVAHGGEGDPLGRSLRADHQACVLCHTELKDCGRCDKDYKTMDLSMNCSRPECHANTAALKSKTIKVDHPKHVKLLEGKCAPCHSGHLKQGYKRVGDHKVCGTKKCHAKEVEGNCTLCHKW